MLQIRDPRHCRDGQPPPEEARRFNDDIDARGVKRRCGIAIKAKCQRRGQTRLAIECVRSDDLDCGNSGKLGEFILVGAISGKHHRNELAGLEPRKRREQVTLIIVAAGP